MTAGERELIRNWWALPENERDDFKRAIAARATEWRKGYPAIWPIVLRIEQDPLV